MLNNQYGQYRPSRIWVVDAHYIDLRIPSHRSNPLIRALPRSLSEEQLLDVLSEGPEYDEEQRQWETHERLHMLLGLSHFMAPLEAHISLARVLDSMMREGYVGRAPMTKEHTQIYQELYKKRQTEEDFKPRLSSITPQLSTSLLGLSGMGKTTTVKRFLGTIPHVIRHKELGISQVPWLHIEMTSDGKSVKAIAAAILKALDKLIPEARYYETYYGSGKVGAGTLLISVGMLMNTHLVGMLVIDEVQNLANSPKGMQVVMAELVSVCNDLEVPILFIGTNKAEKVLGLDFRQGRRSLSFALGHWGALPFTDEDGQPGEWVGFMEVLWAYQWVKHPFELTPEMLKLFYDCTQGVIDLAIKLFVASQARAMIDGSETVTENLVASVFSADLKLVHPMVLALQNGDLAALAKYEDIAPIGVEDLVNDMARRYKGKRTFAASVKPGHEDFVPRLAVAGIALGLDPEQAQEVADAVEKDGKAKNMLEAAKHMADKLSTLRKVAGTKPKAPDIKTDFEDRPQDYRRAIALAHESGTTVFEQLKHLGFARPVLELVSLA